MIGDIVKRDPRDPMSGTVMAMDVNVLLMPPIPWAESPPWTDVPARSWDLDRMVGPISASDLAWPPHIEISDIVIYKNRWVGRVADSWQEATIRLGNGSVVVAENEDDVTPIYSDLACEVGDRVKTKKANLRRGRWIFGSYDPNVAPVGVILNLQTTSITVDWLASTSDALDDPDPDSELGQDILQSGDVHLYDPQRTPDGVGSSRCSSGLRNRCRLDVKLCDIVKFHDLLAACEYYNKENRLTAELGVDSLRRIPRQDSLGYDINWFMVARKETTIRVQWQDLSESTLLAREVVPTLDLDDDEDVWPGEIVCTRASKDNDRATYSPKRVGVAQAVNAKDRIAKVRWFEGAVSFPADDKSVLLPGSWTGNLEPQAEDCSLYDIWTIPALTRRPGDFVTLSKFHQAVLAGDQIAARNRYLELERLLDDRSSPRNFFGEIISLGIDGMLLVRLGASETVRDVKIPFECTTVVQMGDWDQDLMEDEEDSEAELLSSFLGHEDEEYVSGMLHAHRPSAHWLDENDHPIDDSIDDEWEDDGDSSDITSEAIDHVPVVDHNTARPSDKLPSPGQAKQNSAALFDMANQIRPGNGSRPGPSGVSERIEPALSAKPPLPSDHVSLVGSDFTYARMLDKLAAEERPEPMMILEGAAPADHHFTDARSGRLPSGSLLRRIHKEIGMLQNGLPEGVFVRTWEQAIDLFRFVFVGPLDTPYEYVPVVIDIHLHSGWPSLPPRTFFHSWTDGSAPINPNLYEDGKICLSLLGTWPGEEQQQGWLPTSTILQLVVSILGLVLVKEPYFNEAGFEVRAGAVEARIPSALYSERTYFRSRSFIKHALDFPIRGFEDVVDVLYKPSDRGANLLLRAIWSAAIVLERSRRVSEQGETTEEGRTVSKGALIPLRREILALVAILDEQTQQLLTEWINGGQMPSGNPGAIFTELAAIRSHKP